MKRLLAYIIVAVVATAFGGCQRGAEMRRALLRADSLMYPQPDSALALLRSLDMSRATEAQMARYALLVTKAEYKTNVIQRNDSLISIAVDYYAGRGDSLEMQSLFYKGHIKRWKKCDNEALIQLAKALRIAKKATTTSSRALSTEPRPRSTAVFMPVILNLRPHSKQSKRLKRLTPRIMPSGNMKPRRKPLYSSTHKKDSSIWTQSAAAPSLPTTVVFRHGTMMTLYFFFRRQETPGQLPTQ